MPMQKAERENARAMQLSKGEETAGEQGKKRLEEGKNTMFFVKGEGKDRECGTDTEGMVDELEGAEDIVSVSGCYLRLLPSILKAQFKPTQDFIQI